MKRYRLIFSSSVILILIMISSAGSLRQMLFEEQYPGNTERESLVGFTARTFEPSDMEIERMIDEILYQHFGEEGIAAICSPGDRVVIKVNLVGPHRGKEGESGKAVITDPRIVRGMAERIRDVIGWEEPANIIVTDATFYLLPNPSSKIEETSFYHARLERTGDFNIDPEDVCYDFNADGILDGTSGARLVNSDSWGMGDRYETIVYEPTLGDTKIFLPNFLRTKEQAEGELPYCDLFIGLPVFKSHGFTGITGALKLMYGLRYNWPRGEESGRANHSGYGWGTGNKDLLIEYICAQAKTKPFDFILLDALTGNRRGPLNIRSNNPKSETDYIGTFALMGSRDPVALDTAIALFAGYHTSSIGLLKAAAHDGLGEDRPEYIRIAGFDAFARQKQFLFNTYNMGSRNGRRKKSYPFYHRWGGAKVKMDFQAPEIVDAAVDSRGMTISYRLRERGKKPSGYARADLLVNGSVKAVFRELSKEGIIHIPPNAYEPGDELRIAVWDNALNCAVSQKLIPVPAYEPKE